MQTKNMKIALILSAQDRMSAAVAAATAKAQRSIAAMQRFGMGSAGIGAAALASMTAPIKAFADLEDAGLRLKAVMMRDGGVLPEALFQKMNAQAIYLGNLLPGTTADFQNLYATMLEQGTPANAILNGAGKAAAYLAVQLKMGTEEAGVLASRLRLQMGIADKDMMSFMDIMARIKNMGVDPVEMQYAFGRSAGAMKLLNIQGLQATKTMGILYAMLIKEGGATGETAGTGVSKLLNELLNPNKMAGFTKAANAAGLSFQFFDKGRFLGMENFVAQLTKFQGMDPEKISKILLPLTGGEGMDNQFVASLSKLGADGFNAYSKIAADQATLQMKVDLMLTSLTNMWEAAMGAFTNTMAAFASTFAPHLKFLTSSFGYLSERLQVLIKTYPNVAKWTGLVVGTFGLLAVACGTVSLAAAGVLSVISPMITMFGGLFTAIRWLIPTLGKFHTIIWAVGNALNFMAVKVMILRTYLTTVLWPALVQATTAAWGFAAALLANPITWIVIGILALGAALVYAYYKSDKFRAALNGIWEVAKLLGSVFYALGKTIIGALTFNPKMMMSGVKEMAALTSKIMDGEITKRFNVGYNTSMATSKAAMVSSQAGKPGINVMSGLSSNRPSMMSPAKPSVLTPAQPNFGGRAPAFQTTININGPVDKNNIGMIGNELEKRVKKIIKEANYNKQRVSNS